jgi:uncharacterized membrane protein
VPAPAFVRLQEIDWLRGLVMVLMTIDHASAALNPGRLMTDSPFMHAPGAALPVDQFLTRWISHLCAPTFVFLAGAALALSVTRRVAAGDTPRSIDRAIVTRGVILLILEAAWMSLAFTPGKILLQVLYALGGAMICMALLRRLPVGVLAVAGLALIAGSEALAGLALDLSGGGMPPVAVGLLLTSGFYESVIVAYPLIPWLAIMMVGWAWGTTLATRPPRPRSLVVAGVAALAVFAAVRGANGYGNMRLWREDGSLVQWLHVSKYPPSLSFTALELGVMAVLLALFARLRLRGAAAPALQILELFGSVALFYYLLHVHLLEVSGLVLGKPGLAVTYLAAALTLIVLYPLCSVYRQYKAAHPHAWTRYI